MTTNRYLAPVDDGLPMRPSGVWATEKLHYVQRYVEVFCTAMRKRWPVRCYVDLMAGPGKNRVRQTDQVLLGSPLIALTATHPFTDFYFAEADRSNYAALVERCSASDLSSRVQCELGDANLLVNQLVLKLARKAPNSLNMAFLDPQGLELHWSTIAKLAAVQRMDLIINYPLGGLNRVMRNVYDSTHENAVDRLFGDRTWREIYIENTIRKRGLVHRELIDLLRTKLSNLGYQVVADSPEPLMRNVARKAPLYRLLFASKHPLGSTFWAEINRVDAHGQRRLFD